MTKVRQLGFSLVEALVAFAVLAIGLASAGTAFALAMRTDADLAAKRQTREFALSRLEAAGITDKLSIGRRSGRDGEWGWAETVRAVRLATDAAPANATPAQAALQGFWVEVEVEGPGGQVARLAGLKVRGPELP